MGKLKNVAQLYEIIIDASIKMCVYKHCGNNVNSKALNTIRDALKRLAWLDIEGRIENRDFFNKINQIFLDRLNKTLRNKLDENFKIWEILIEDSDFMVDSNNNFYFVGCKHYLIAEKLLELFQEENEFVKKVLCNPIFLEKANYQIYFFLLDMIKDKIKDDKVKEKYFDIIWSSITDEQMAGENNRVNILVNLMERFGLMFNVTYTNKFFEFILKELSNQYYDSYVFDTIHSINLQYPQFGINNYLQNCYKNLEKSIGESQESIDNQKRRLAYYFGKEKCGISEKLIEDLINPDVHNHVKYHIILAIIENYDLIHVEGMLKKYEKKIMAYEDDWKKDCILYCDYLILQSKRNNMDLEHGEREFILQRQLCEKLTQGEYWKRAHAAGALGRLGLFGSVYNLLDQLKDEIKQLKTDGNSLKAVSYIVESICELFYTQNKNIEKKGDEIRKKNCCEGVKKCIKNFKDLLLSELKCENILSDIDIFSRFLVAFATISEGIVYLIDSVENKMPEDIGKHIKDGKKDLKGNYFSILKALNSIDNKYGDDSSNIKEKLEIMYERYNQIGEMSNLSNKKTRTSDIQKNIINNNESIEAQQNIANGGVGIVIQIEKGEREK